MMQDRATDMVRTRGFSAAEQAQIFAAALALSLAAAVAFAAIFVLRLGLGDTVAQVGSLYLLTTLPLWTTVFAVTRFPDTARGGAGAMMIAFLGASLLPIAGLWLGNAVAIAAAVLVLPGLLTRVAPLVTALRNAKLAMLLAALFSALLLIVTSLPDRFLLPEQLLLGFAASDEYFHTALAGMVAHYHRFAIGADGLSFMPYHFLSHVIAAGLSKTTGTDVPHVYLYWGAFTLKLQLLWAFFMASLFFSRESTAAPRAMLWRLAYAWLAVMAATVFESESYVAGMAFVLATLPFLLGMRLRDGDFTPRLLGAALLAVAAVFVCTAAKITSGFFAAIALAVMAWHLRRNATAFGAIVAGLAALAAFTWLKVLPRGNAGQSIMELLSSYNQYFTWQTVFSYALPVLVLAIYILRPQLVRHAADRRWEVALHGTAPVGWRGYWRWMLEADSEPQFLFLSLLACVAVFAGVPMGSNIAFFSLVLFTVALLLLPPALEFASGARLDASVVRFAVGAPVLLCCIPMAISFGFSLWLVLANLQVEALRVTHAPPQRLKDSIITSLRATHAPFTNLHTLLLATPMARLKSELAHREAAGDLAVHIDSSDDGMWRWLEGKSPHWCMAPQLPVPSVTGTVELRSFSPRAVEMECSPGGANYYAPADVNARRSTPVSDDALCRIAAPLHVRDVYVLNSLTDLSRNRDIACGR